MIKIIGDWTKGYWGFKLIGDSRWPGPRSYSPGNTVTHSRLQVRFNITRDTFTLHDQQRGPFTFLYTYIVAGPIAMPVCLTLLVFHQCTFHFGCLSPARNWQAFSCI